MGKVKKAFGAFLVPLLSVLLAFLIGGIIMAALGANPFLAVKFLFQGAFGSKAGIGTTLTKATPLIFTALCACFAYKCGVFNLGGEGQFLMGSIAAFLTCYFTGLTGFAGVLLALLVGLVIGFFLPAGLAASASIHKGFDLYSAALPVGMTAFFLHFLLYGVIGAARGNGTGATTLLTYAAPTAVNVFCLSLFGLCIVFALLFGCKPKDYLSLLKDSGHGVDFSQKYGPAAMLMNVGVFGLFILAYYDLVALLSGNGAVFNGVTFGCIFCMLATCCSGSHPRNVLPVILGYVAASMLLRLVSGALPETDFKLTLDAQAILIGLCFANGLSPISGRFGPLWGIVAGALHYCLVTGVPLLHGAFCLYNGGFTAAIVCILLVPVLEHFSKRAKQ